jgi:hypothetical protein
LLRLVVLRPRLVVLRPRLDVLFPRLVVLRPRLDVLFARLDVLRPRLELVLRAPDDFARADVLLDDVLLFGVVFLVVLLRDELVPLFAPRGGK